MNVRAMAGRRLLEILVCLIYTTHIKACLFPEFLQTKGKDNIRKREWHSHLTNHGRENFKHYSLATYFYDNVMQVYPYGGEQSKNRPNTHNRECIMQISETQFLAREVDTSHQDDKQNVKFLCMEFLSRSANVFQLKESKYSKYEDLNLCKDMKLNNWVYVNKADFYDTYTDCPLSGGYNIKMYDKQNAIGVCDGFNSETRIEVDCINGEGLTFLYRNSRCIPAHINMHTTQKTYCIASWTHGRNTFSVLRHNNAESVWCLRYPTNRTDQFTAYLFKSLYCDTENLPEGKHYIVIDMVADKPRGVEQLCMDDFEACSYWSKPCLIPGSKQQMTCAKRCAICQDSGINKRPVMCTIPEVFRGAWSMRDDKEVFIDNSTMRLSGYTSMQCVEWDIHKYKRPDVQYIEQMFVTTFENGCRPRYFCSQLKKHSPSVLRLKLSQGEIWPFEGTNGVHIGCGGFHYKDDNDAFISQYSSKHFQPLISQVDTVYVNCHLGPEKKFEVIFDDNTKCTGSLSQDGLSAVNKMKLTLYGDCNGRQTQQEFACLDSIKHMHFSKQIIVTETLDYFAARIKCWVFPTYPENLFYLMSVEDCNEGSYEKVNQRHVKPIATFQIMNNLQVTIIEKKTTKHTSPIEGYHTIVHKDTSIDSENHLNPPYSAENVIKNENTPNLNEKSTTKRTHEKKAADGKKYIELGGVIVAACAVTLSQTGVILHVLAFILVYFGFC